MQSLVGKRVKFTGSLDYVHWLGLDYSAAMLWSNTGVVQSGPNSAGDDNRQWCLVLYTSEHLVESFMLPVELLEVVDEEGVSS